VYYLPQIVSPNHFHSFASHRLPVGQVPFFRVPALFFLYGCIKVHLYQQIGKLMMAVAFFKKSWDCAGTPIIKLASLGRLN
jgi:hypothetical protein